MSSSYCDINALIKDNKKHPRLKRRIQNWKEGCSVGSNGCLSDDELACFSSYQLGSAREKLDESLADIYQPQNSVIATFDSNYQTTMLTGIVWAALGTTVLYYAFTKI